MLGAEEILLVCSGCGTWLEPSPARVPPIPDPVNGAWRNRIVSELDAGERVLLSEHAEQRRRERVPGMSVDDVAGEISGAIAAGRVERRTPFVWYARSEDGRRTYSLVTDRSALGRPVLLVVTILTHDPIDVAA